MNEKQLRTLKRNNEESREFTRNCISAALIVLLNKEKLENITITRLCQVAGVSRMAFYRNYQSIDEVLVDKIELFANRRRKVRRWKKTLRLRNLMAGLRFGSSSSVL